MAKKEERVFLYQFPEDQIHTAKNVFRALGIRIQTLSREAWREKVALEDAGIPRITYKSAITPYNTMWTLRYLCEHMEKEHAPAVEDREGKV